MPRRAEPGIVLACALVSIACAGCTALGLFDQAPAIGCVEDSDCRVPGLIEDSCVTFACDTSRRICVGHLEDADGDGQAAIGCAASPYADTGTPTDCDDVDGATFVGAPEICSGTDNDCDGRVDESCSSPHLAVGGAHSCFLAGLDLVCWGQNDQGQLGLGSVEPTGGHPRRVSGAEGAISIVAGWDNTCAFLSDGRVMCWGNDDRGQLALPPMPGRRVVPTEVPALRGATALALGRFHSCALLDGHVACFGRNLFGELGDGTTNDSVTPVVVPGTDGAVSIAVTEQFSCAVLADRSISCWGAGTLATRLCDTPLGHAPCTIVDPPDALTVTLGTLHACATRPSGPPACWGDMSFGQLGGPVVSGRGASDVAIGDTVDVLRAGAVHSCLLANGTAYCWGSDQLDQVGQGLMATVTEPLHVQTDVTDFVDIGAGAMHTCGLRATGEVLCWGNNFSGQLGRWDDANATAEPQRPLANWRLDGSR